MLVRADFFFDWVLINKQQQQQQLEVTSKCRFSQEVVVPIVPIIYCVWCPVDLGLILLPFQQHPTDICIMLSMRVIAAWVRLYLSGWPELFLGRSFFLGSPYTRS